MEAREGGPARGTCPRRGRGGRSGGGRRRRERGRARGERGLRSVSLVSTMARARAAESPSAPARAVGSRTRKRLCSRFAVRSEEPRLPARRAPSSARSRSERSPAPGECLRRAIERGRFRPRDLRAQGLFGHGRASVRSRPRSTSAAPTVCSWLALRNARASRLALTRCAARSTAGAPPCSCWRRMPRDAGTSSSSGYAGSPAGVCSYGTKTELGRLLGRAEVGCWPILDRGIAA